MQVRHKLQQSSLCIKKTCLYNFDPLKPHFYTVKLGFTGVYIIFLISAQKHRLWYSLELPRWGGSNKYLQLMFWAEIWKISKFFIWKFSVFGDENFYIQSTLVISNSKGLSEILRDIRSSTYQVCRIEEKIIWLTTFNKLIGNWTFEVRDLLKILWKRGEIAPLEQFLLFSTIFSICC